MSVFQRVGIIKKGKYVSLPNNIRPKKIGRTATHFFPEGLWREMSYAGEHISSKGKLKEECYKRGMISPYFDIYPRNSGLEEESDEKERESRKAEEAKEAEQSNNG